MNRYLRFSICGVAGILLSASAIAAEVYKWVDEDGVMHFSDNPPKSGNVDTLNMDHTVTSSGIAPQASNNSAAENLSGAEPSAAQQRRDEIAAARQEKKEQQAEYEELCKKHKDRLERMEPARRVMYTNNDGEVVRMDDDQRMAMIEFSRDFIGQNCE